jgi:hypothetical protein
MSVLDIAKDVALKVGLAQPDTFFGNSEPEIIELRSTFKTVARAIIDEYDWQILREIATITGNGALTSFPFPTDYGRMLKKAAIWPSDMQSRPLEHITDSDVWLRDEVATFIPLYPQWTIYGGKIRIRPTLANGVTAKYFYMKRYVTVDAKTAFNSDADVFIIDENLLFWGVVVQWKTDKGIPYSEDLASYNAALDILVGADKGSKILTVGKQRLSGGSVYAFPRALGR